MIDRANDLVLQALDAEIDSLLHFRKAIGREIAEAVVYLMNSKGKVIVTGVGKSGDIARKISHTLSSTGTVAVFLHPTDASHGDSGIVAPEDTVIAIGKSGESDELNYILPTLKRIGAKIIGITANRNSKLADFSDMIIETPVWKEACPLDLAPTSSTTIALVVGDAIAMALMGLKNFQAEDFALFHPAGRLGKRLSLHISDVMRKGEQNASVTENATLSTVLEEITTKGLGGAGVCDENGKLKGLITDNDIRRALSKGLLVPETKARDIMNPNPTAFGPGQKAFDVLAKMENRNRPISVAPIIDSSGAFLGMVTVHDLLQKGL